MNKTFVRLMMSNIRAKEGESIRAAAKREARSWFNVFYEDDSTVSVKAIGIHEIDMTKEELVVVIVWD